MKDLMSFAVLIVLVVSKVVAVGLILLGPSLVLSFLAVATISDPSLPSADQWAEFWGRILSLAGLAILGVSLAPSLIGFWLFKLPTLNWWQGPDDVKRPVDDLC